jgi:hypothetical protein
MLHEQTVVNMQIIIVHFHFIIQHFKQILGPLASLGSELFHLKSILNLISQFISWIQNRFLGIW